MASKLKAGILAAALMMSSMPSAYAGPKDGLKWDEEGEGRNIRHVLLISIDGMHALDFENCSNGISTINGGQPYCPNLAELGQHGVNYLGASASKPSDSFPGLTALVTGGSPRATGVFYDAAYDRSLDPPAQATGNGLLPGLCIAGAPRLVRGRNTKKASASIRTNLMEERRAALMVDASHSIRPRCPVTPARVARLFILGTS